MLIYHLDKWIKSEEITTNIRQGMQINIQLPLDLYKKGLPPESINYDE